MESEIRSVEILPVTLYSDERGCVHKLHHNLDLQDVYVTTVHQGVVKGFHGYNTKRINFTCIKGKVKLVLWDGRDYFETYYIGDEARYTVSVPAGTYTAFKGISQDNILLITADEPFTEEGMMPRIDPHNVGYDWSCKHG
jgi:dTDP-4-dehydrorhamnose 3,5-epimerase